MNEFQIDAIINLALAAGALEEKLYRAGITATQKADGSSVTEADQQAEALILAGLKKIAPQIPVLAEESAAAGNIPELGNLFFLVDPLDGTREFINGTDEFTVNIALIENNYPVFGVVFAPACKKLYVGIADKGAWMKQIEASVTDHTTIAATPLKCRPVPSSNRIAVASRSHRTAETDALLSELQVSDFSPAGSSLKFCLVAEGKADVYPRLGRTMEWDIGAGQAVLEAAGGCVHEYDSKEGARLCYNKKQRGFDNPHFIAWGKR